MDDFNSPFYQSVALGADNGFIYLLNKQRNICQYAKVDFCVSKLISWKKNTNSTKQTAPLNSKQQMQQQLNCEIVVCVGHFNGIKFYQNKSLLFTQITPDWPHSIAIGDLDNDLTQELVVGLQNNSIQVYKLP